MIIQILQKTGLNIPVKNTPEDAGFDVITTTEPNIVGTNIFNVNLNRHLWSRVVYIEYGTNLFVAPDVAYHLEVFPRSSVSKYNLILANSIGLIDNGYRGEIRLRYKYIFQPEDFIVLDEAGGRRVWGMVNNLHIYQKGEKLAQIVPAQTIDAQFVIEKELPPSNRMTGGFGSSGQ